MKITVLRPNWMRTPRNKGVPDLRDYIQTDHVALHGTYTVEEMVRFTRRRKAA